MLGFHGVGLQTNGECGARSWHRTRETAGSSCTRDTGTVRVIGLGVVATFAGKVTEFRPSLRWRLGQVQPVSSTAGPSAASATGTVIVRPHKLQGVERIHLGAGCSVFEGAWLASEPGGGDLRVGDRTYLGHDVHLHALDPVTIGSDCVIADGVFVGSSDHDRDDRHQVHGTGPISIGDRVFLGQRCGRPRRRDHRRRRDGRRARGGHQGRRCPARRSSASRPVRSERERCGCFWSVRDSTATTEPSPLRSPTAATRSPPSSTTTTGAGWSHLAPAEAPAAAADRDRSASVPASRRDPQGCGGRSFNDSAGRRGDQGRHPRAGVLGLLGGVAARHLALRRGASHRLERRRRSPRSVPWRRTPASTHPRSARPDSTRATCRSRSITVWCRSPQRRIRRW